MQAGRFDEAAQKYEALLKSYPNAKEILLALGICYVQLERRNEAIGLLSRYVKLAPRSAAGHAVLGIALLDGSKTAESKAELETAVRLDPKQSDAVEALARIYLIEGNASEAVSLLRAAISVEANEELQALLSEALVKSGQVEAACLILDRKLENNSNSTPRIYALAAWAHLKAGDTAKTAEICERGMRLYPESEIEAVYLSLPAPYLSERIGARIENLQKHPDVSELIAVGRVLVDADPAHKTNANEIAQRLLAHAIVLSPENASAHYNYGRALRQDSIERALTEWEKALSLQSTNELRLDILVKIAGAKLDLTDFKGAESAFQAALEINRKLSKRNPEAMLEYVRFLQLTSRSAEAEALLNEVLSWNPLSPQAHLERAKLLVAHRAWDQVVNEGEFVLRNAGEDQELLRGAHMLLARAYLVLNQPEKAKLHQSWIDSH
jgi:tetratricopeptide (TPR) repeat protein